jgi:hypothetical protein
MKVGDWVKVVGFGDYHLSLSYKRGQVSKISKTEVELTLCPRSHKDGSRYTERYNLIDGYRIGDASKKTGWKLSPEDWKS